MSSILLIEPDAVLGKTYAQALEQQGHTVMICRGAQEAVLKADAAKPEVVILELHLPGHSGVEFLYEFRSYPEWQDVPVIVHTVAPEEKLAIPDHVGVKAYLYKPATNLRQLLRVVDQHTVAV